MSVSLSSTLTQCVGGGGGGGGGGDDDMIMMVMIMSQMVTKLSICCGLVAQSEVHPKCCPSHSSTLSHSLSVQLVVVMTVMMMMKLSVWCGLVVVSHNEVHHKCCLSHSAEPSVSMWLVFLDDGEDDDEAECLLWTCGTL